MKIVFLQDDFKPYALGGSAMVVDNIARVMAEEGHDVYVITSVQQESQAGSFLEDGVQIERVYVPPYDVRWRSYNSLYNKGAVKEVKIILKKLQPDVVHAHNIHYYLSYACLKVAKQSGAKVFLTAHDVMSFHYGKLVEFVNPNDLSCPERFNYKVSPLQQIKKYKKRYNPFRNAVIRYYLKYIDRIFAVSNALKEALNQNGIQNVEVIYNGIDIDKWKADTASLDAFRKKCNLYDKKVVLFGGRLSGAKGGHQAILALEEIIKEVPEVMLVVMGNKNEYAQKMIKVARDRGIDNHLIFTGWIEQQEEIKVIYAVSDVVLLPSVCFDSFPTINLEAMASKKPVVGTCYGGSREVVVDGVTGYIVNPLNVKKMASKTIDLLNNPQKAEMFGRAGYEKVKGEFSLKKSVKEYLDRFNKI